MEKRLSYMYKLLVVDDEPDILRLLKDYFELQGHLVLLAHNGPEAIEKASIGPDLMLLDINMPGMDGLEVCKRLRQHLSCPILFLTAKVTEQDRINGLLTGGDDYILKPFCIDELGARVAAHLRREARNVRKESLKFIGDLTINFNERSIYYQQEEIPFSRTEFDILEYLCMNRGQVFSKERIYEKLWGYDSDGDSKVVTELIRRIRNKFSEHTEREFIQTVWGCGYQWLR
jgi:DNA-binding response OmpR family regulator